MRHINGAYTTYFNAIRKRSGHLFQGRYKTIAEILGKVKAIFGEDPVMSKKVSLYLCHRYSGATLKEIGDNFDIGESAVSQTSRLFSIKIDNDSKLQTKINNIVNELKLCNV